jgi:hypothetical protein
MIVVVIAMTSMKCGVLFQLNKYEYGPSDDICTLSVISGLAAQFQRVP